VEVLYKFRCKLACGVSFTFVVSVSFFSSKGGGMTTETDSDLMSLLSSNT